MTKQEFEQGYAERSGVPIDQLHERGYKAIPCDCGEDECKGWMIQLRLEGNNMDMCDDTY